MTIAFALSLAAASVRAQSADLAGIAHVAFRVSDLSATRAFYAKLGFEQAFAFGNESAPDVSYIKINDRQFIELYRRTVDSQPLGFQHVCFEATDLNALFAEYEKRGLTPSSVKKARAGNLLFMFRGPEGQLLEYTQYLPGSLHSAQFGKHLSAKRVSTEVRRLTIPAKDVSSERAFFVSKLSFIPRSGPSDLSLQLPGTSRQEIAFVALPAAAEFLFSVADLQKTAAALRSSGFIVESSATQVSIRDPDGTRISFAKFPREGGQ